MSKQDRELEVFVKSITGEPTTEEKLAELAKDRELFSSEEALNYADVKKKLEMPTIGYHVYYKPLTISNRIDINSVTDPDQNIQRDKRNRRKVYLILARCYPQLTQATIDGWAANMVDTILSEYDKAEDGRFLPPLMKRRLSG